MSFLVCQIDNVSQLDSVPVAVVKHYPLETRDYKPYAQANLCLAGGDLLLRMWAFEVLPPPGSILKAVLALFPERENAALELTLDPQGECALCLLEDGVSKPLSPPEGFRIHPHNGEDLQGVYWGGMLTLSPDWLASVGGRAALAVGDHFSGNFYKLCPGPEQAHQGSYFPADFAKDPFALASRGDFLVVSY